MAHLRRSFISIELCFPLSTCSPQHEEAVRLLHAAEAYPTSAKKWDDYQRLANQLLSVIGLATRGCWEYMDDDSDDAMWNDWLQPFKAPSKRPQGEQNSEWFTITFMFQLTAHSKSDRRFAQVYRVHKNEPWKRPAFRDFLLSIPALSMASIMKDAVYVMPRDKDSGFSDREINSERMNYLRPIEGQ